MSIVYHRRMFSHSPAVLPLTPPRHSYIVLTLFKNQQLFHSTKRMPNSLPSATLEAVTLRKDRPRCFWAQP